MKLLLPTGEIDTMTKKLAIKEDDILIACFDWVKQQAISDSRFKLFCHIPNEGKRSWAQGKRMKSKGLSKGFPDVIFFYPVGHYKGIAIEFKSETGNLNEQQAEWLLNLKKVGWLVVVVKSFDSFKWLIEHYLDGKINGR